MFVRALLAFHTQLFVTSWWASLSIANIDSSLSLMLCAFACLQTPSESFGTSNHLKLHGSILMQTMPHYKSHTSMDFSMSNSMLHTPCLLSFNACCSFDETLICDVLCLGLSHYIFASKLLLCMLKTPPCIQFYFFG